MISNFKKTLKKNETIVKGYDGVKQFYYKNLISDEQLIRKNFKKRMGREVELENPIKFNDKLQWLKLNWYDPRATTCADKYKVREYVKEKIGEEYLNELIAVYESVDEIEIDKLPKSFVLKGTHGSGFNIICEDKSKLNWNDEFKNMRRWLRKNYYLQNQEWIYKDIKPRIIAEKYLEEISRNELVNYKVFCFDGEPKFLYVENEKKQTIDFYDLNWNRIPVSQYYPNSKYELKRPRKLDQILGLSKELASKFPHVRVDFYIFLNKILFSELTFFNWSGCQKFTPGKYDEVFGSYLNLSNIEKNKL